MSPVLDVSCISGSHENKMSTKSPVIKFSPFEALLIGEKNKIVKHEPMKNTIFVTRVNQQRKTFNLRDLFDLEEDTTNPDKKDVIFKMPQRVREFFKSRKLNSKSSDRRERKDILYFDYNGKRMVVKNNRPSKPKNAKIKSKKIKFKKKIDFTMTSGDTSISRGVGGRNKTNICSHNSRVVKKFPSRVSKLRNYQMQNNRSLRRLIIRDIDKIKNKRSSNAGKLNRHSLRGKDGKFISKKSYQEIEFPETSKEKLMSGAEMNGKKMELNSNKDSDMNKPSKDNQKVVVKMIQNLNTTALDSPDKYYDSNCSGMNFKFPKCPEKGRIREDLDDDVYLMDIIYENFPVFKFEGSESLSQDFGDCLRSQGIIPPEKHLKIYEKKKNGFFNPDKLTLIFNNHLPYIKLRTVDAVKSISYPCKNGFRSVIDEPCTKKSHLINAKSFDCFFLRNSEDKEIFIGNLMKPFWPNSWFGRLPDV